MGTVFGKVNFFSPVDKGELLWALNQRMYVTRKNLKITLLNYGWPEDLKFLVCAELEISGSALDDWIKKAGADRGGTLAGKDPGELSSKELLELSRDQGKTIKRLE